MRHNKVRDFDGFMRSILKYFEIYPITPANNKDNIFTLIFLMLDHFSKLHGVERFSSFIEENNLSFYFFKGFNNQKRFLYFYIFGIGVRNWLDWFEENAFSEAFPIFGNRFAKVFESIGNSKNGNHRIG